MNPFLGEIRMFSGNYAPRFWAFCDGQLLSIAENNALFSIINTTYGGDGRTTFALPDLRGRVPIHQGQAPGLSNQMLGQSGGSEQTERSVTQMKNGSEGNTALLSGFQPSANNMQPYLAVNFIIALEGEYPPRGD